MRPSRHVAFLADDPESVRSVRIYVLPSVVRMVRGKDWDRASKLALFDGPIGSINFLSGGTASLMHTASREGLARNSCGKPPAYPLGLQGQAK